MSVCGSRIEKLIIVGGGTAGWMAAAALSRFLPKTCKISLIESDEIGTIGVGESTIPQMTLFNQSLGIDEAEFVRQTSGAYKLGIEFVDWKRVGQRYFHGFGSVGRNVGLVPFHHFWLRSLTLGNRNDLGAYSANALAAAHGKFGKPKSLGRSSQFGFGYAYHIDAIAYAQFLRRFAERGGVERIEGRIVDVMREPGYGNIASLILADGRQLAGDFYFDCTGFASLLLGKALDVKFEDWTHWLPCDRAWAVPTVSSGGPPVPYTRATARNVGWQWRIPLQHREGNGIVYASSFQSDEDALETLLSSIQGKPLLDPRALRFKTGRRERLWEANCIALGLSGGFLEPLEATSIYLIQSGIARALRYFPALTGDPTEHDAFNEESALEYAAIRDFLILHYHANERRGEPFWDACRTMQIPDTLARKLDLFRSHGRIFRENLELFDVSSWLQVMWGQGIAPTDYHPLADRVDAADLRDMLEETRSTVNKMVAQLPVHAAFLAQSGAAIQHPS